MDINSLIMLAIDCTSQEIINVMSIVGIVVWGLKIAVPIILIVIGMVELGTAIAKKGDDEVKKAQKDLIKKAVVAVIVFLVPTLVTLIMGVISQNDWKACWACVNSPTGTVAEKKDKDGNVIHPAITCGVNTEVN